MATFTGDENGNVIVGTADDDTIDGLGGNDTLDGGAGADVMLGGTGDDYYLIDSMFDRLVEAIGAGFDTAFTTTSFTLEAGSQIEALRVRDPATVAAVDLHGNEYHQILSGNAAANYLSGHGGDDYLEGRGGSDTLDGGSGDDVLRGGTDSDYYLVDSALDRVLEAAGEGHDAVFTSASFALEAGAEVEELRAIDAAGSAALNLTGNEFGQVLAGNAGANRLDGRGGDDYLEGRGGNDTLDGGAGADVLRGGTGSDYYLIDSSADRVLEALGEGFDTAFTTVSYALEAGSEVEGLRVADAAGNTAINLTGNEVGQVLAGNEGANVLNGGGGDDYLEGRGGIDTLEGGSGNDVLRGGSGGDYYLVDNSDRVLEATGEGYDTIFTSTSFTLEAGSAVEELRVANGGGVTALNLTGNEFGQVLSGNDGANVLTGGGGDDHLEGRGGIDTLDGGSGDDVLRGGMADDYYIIDSAFDRVLEAQNEGHDAVFTTVSFALEAGSFVEELRVADAAGAAALNLTGNESGQVLAGNAGANVLIGGGGQDHLEGRGGSDTLDGGTGEDVLRGGTGNDYYRVDSVNDRVLEAAGEGYDTAFATVSFALEAGAEIEELRLADVGGTLSFDLTGNEFAQLLSGNAGMNVLFGGGGSDTLVGLGGDDVLDGGGGADTLNGDSGNDQLDGGLGSDVLVGGVGADRFVFSTALSQNIDDIRDFDVDQDRIVLAGDPGAPFAELTSGLLHYEYFAAGTAATTNLHRIIYDSASGAVSYDADGVGGQAAVQFATIAPGTQLSGSNFIIAGAPNRAPTFASSSSVTVVENQNVATIVYQANAVDPDGDRLTYSLSGDDRQFFSIDAAGAVRFIAPAQNETKATYNFDVWAYESDGTGVRKSVTLTLANDPNAPPYVVAESSLNDTRAQAMPLDRALFRVTTDINLVDDDLPSARINGSVSSATDKDFFSVTLNAGELLILDIDGTTALDSNVRVFDQNGIELTSNDDLVTFDPGSTAHAGVAHNMDSLVKMRAPTSGTYYFSVEAFAETSGVVNIGTYVLNVSIGPRASAAQLIEEDVQALLSGSSWTSTNLTYSFPTSVDQYSAGEAVNERGSFQPLLAAQQTAVRQVLAQAANLTDLMFTDILSSQGSAQLRYARTTEGETAHAYYPGFGNGGDSWYNSASGNYDRPLPGNYAWTTFLHETGHALGLKHGHESPALSPLHNSLEFSVMTYSSYVGARSSADGGYTNEEFGYPQTYMMFDIAGLQRMYGADFAANAGDSLYTWDANSGAFLINGVLQRTPGANRVFMTLWDGGGNDTYDLSNYSGVGTGVQIDLRPGEWSLFSAVQKANLGDGRYAIGNVANALQYQGDPRSLIENAVGTSGSDVITGNAAVNRLTGGGGSDAFRFFSVEQSSAAAPDSITDFTTDDTLLLSFIDANPATSADDSFYYLHTSAFTGVAGQLRHERIGSDVIVLADVDGDGVADLKIILLNGPDLFANDFLF